MEKNKKEILEIFDKENTITATAREFCKRNGITYSDSIRRRFSSLINGWVDKGLDNETTTETNQYENDKEEEDNFFMPSAWSSEKGRFLSIDEYCDTYGLPKEQVRSSKLVAHQSSHMIYNIVFNETISEQTGIDEKVIEQIVKKHISTKEVLNLPQDNVSSPVTNLTITDIHVGMEPNKDGNSLYGGKWGREELFERLEEIVKFTLNKSKHNNSRELYIRDLGDLADGLDGQTVRGGHELPQNMSNVEVFDTAVEFKVELVTQLLLSGQYSKINLENVCNSNHGGDFDYFINSAVKYILENKFENVVVNNHRKFISHYSVGDHCFIISHGKDDKTLRFGFKDILDSKGLEKIDGYIKGNGLYNKHKYFHFCMGDKHMFKLDFSTSQDFNYFLYPALSPSSQWVQNNFKKGLSGFVVETFNKDEEEIDFYYKKFEWEE